MKFTRLNENVIRCVITKEEMFDYGIEISEIVDNREKAEDFLRKVMQEARYELDYKTTGKALSVQIAILPEGDVAMTIAEGIPDKAENQLQMLKHYLEDFQRLLEQKVAEKQEVEKKEPAKQVGSFISVAEGFWIKCDSLDACINLATSIDDTILKASSLYSYKEEYFFRMEIEGSETKSVGGLLMNLCEYCDEFFLDHEGAPLIYEHGRCILANDAVSTLRDL